MSRKFILFALFSLIQIELVSGQSGEYCRDDFLWSSCYTLFPNGDFEYNELMCVAHIIGRGKYHIGNDSIIFNYEPMELFDNNLLITKAQSNADELYINFQVVDFENGTLIDSIYISSEIYNREFEYLQNTSKPLRLKNVIFPIVIDIGAPYYDFYNVEIEENGNYDVRVKLHSNRYIDQREATKGIEQFTLLALSNDSLIMKDMRSGEELIYLKKERLSNR